MTKRIKNKSNRMRLCVFRSNRHIYAQIIDDVKGQTLCGASSLSPSVAEKKLKNPVEKAREVGKVVSKLAKKKKVVEVVYDRQDNKYTGQVKALAEGAREGGLEF